MTVSTAAKPAMDDARAASVARPLNSLIYVGLAAQSLAIGLCALSITGIAIPGQTFLPFAFLAFFGIALVSLIALTRRIPRVLVKPLMALDTIRRTGHAPADQAAFEARQDVFGAIARRLGELRDQVAAEKAAAASAAAAHAQQIAVETPALDEKSKQALNDLETTLQAFADGNFVHQLKAEFPEEISSLKESCLKAQHRIRSTIQQVSQTVDGLGTGVGEIVSASDDLSRRTERQAVALEETVSTLGTVVEGVRNSAGRLEETSNVARSAREDAVASGRVVDEALTAMHEIENSATKINKIITVIDEIAFQTNLLALNAGVEAARAGDAGQGFAVVASEVRALAQRSAKAAREISSLINQSTQQISDGSRLVNQTGTALKRISDHVLNISQNVQAITECAQEQSRALDSLNSSAVEMDGMTQQNAAMAEEVTAASHSLQRSTVELSGMLKQVRTGEAGPANRNSSRPADPVTTGQGGASLRSAAAALKSGATAQFSSLAAHGSKTGDISHQESRSGVEERRAARLKANPPAEQPAAPARSEQIDTNLTLGNAALDEDWEEF